MSFRRLFAVAATALLIVFGSACSSDKGSSTTTTSNGKTPTKADYVAAANGICTAGKARIDPAINGLATDNDTARNKAFTGTIVPDIRGQLKDIRALGYPKGDQAKLSKLYDEMDKVLDSWAANPKAANTSGQIDPVNKGLSAYGLTACGG